MVTFEMLIDFLVLGIFKGSVYALLATGLTLMYGVMKIINVAHGDLFAFGAYVALAFTLLTMNPFVTLFASMLILFLIGMGIDKILFVPLRSHWGRELKRETYMVLTLGLAMFIQNSIVVTWGADYLRVPGFFTGTIAILFIQISKQRVLVLGVSVCLLLALFIFLMKTRTGMAIRAVSQDADTAQAMGVDIERINTLTLGLSVAFAAAAGTLLAPIFWLSPFFGFPYTFKAVSICILGGLGSIPGALLASLMLGVLESFTTYFFLVEYVDAVGFMMMIAALILRPSGLLGKELK